ncbi:MAG TPA: hypothetical protein VK338_04585 [Candidatus Nitrosocosmicus sp.]|nr:hypothetical protein [Candidatus Nitrosocosmicus sp.]
MSPDIESVKQQIEDDYSEHYRRGYTNGIITHHAFIELAIPFYRQWESYPTEAGNSALSLYILEQAMLGVKEGLVTPELHDMKSLASALLTAGEELKLGAIICPDWGWHTEKGEVIYDMDILNNGFPNTAEKLYAYLTKIADRAQKYQRTTTFSGYYPAWELTREDHLEGVNGGISTEEAIDILEQTRNVSMERFGELENNYFRTDLYVMNPEGYHDLAKRKAEELLKRSLRKVTVVQEARQGFYNGQLTVEEAALELAEAEFGFKLIAPQTDVIVTPTSPTIAKACLSGSKIGWIQLAHGYKG